MSGEPYAFERIIATFWGSEARAYSWLGNTDKRFARRFRTVTVEPSDADWAAYRAAAAGLEALKAYEFTAWDVTDYGDGIPEVMEPRSRKRTEWLETEEEWLARCHALREDMENQA